MSTKYMKITHDRLMPNPHRDFKINPIDQDQVDSIIESYEKNGDMNVISVRPSPDWKDYYEIIGGHHRVEAQQQLGWLVVESKVMDFTDDEMLSGMIDENRTQNGGNPASQLDSVAATIKYLAYHLLSAESFHDLTIQMVTCPFPNQKSFDTSKGLLLSKAQIGKDVIARISHLGDGIIEAKVNELQGTGQIKGIIDAASKRVKDENAEEDARIKAEQKEAEAEAKAAEKREAEAQQRAEEAEEQAKRDQKAGEKRKAESAAKKLRDDADKQERLNREAQLRREQAEANRKQVAKRQAEQKEAKDAAAKKAEDSYLASGVSKLFANTTQVDVFRAAVKANADLVPKDEQVKFAKEMLRILEDSDDGITKRSIQAHFNDVRAKVDKEYRDRIKREEARKAKASKERKAEYLLQDLQQALGKLSGTIGAIDMALKDKEVREWFISKVGRTNIVNALDGLEKYVPIVRKQLNLREMRDFSTKNDPVKTQKGA